jgi:hypothetical protein
MQVHQAFSGKSCLEPTISLLIPEMAAYGLVLQGSNQ